MLVKEKIDFYIHYPISMRTYIKAFLMMEFKEV